MTYSELFDNIDKPKRKRRRRKPQKQTVLWTVYHTILALELLACSFGLSVDGVTQPSNSKIPRYDIALEKYFIPKVSPTVLNFATAGSCW